MRTVDKNQIIEAAFEMIEESVEWGVGSTNDSFANFVDGIVAMTRNLLNKLDKVENNGVPEPGYDG